MLFDHYRICLVNLLSALVVLVALAVNSVTAVVSTIGTAKGLTKLLRAIDPFTVGVWALGHTVIQLKGILAHLKY